MPDLPCVRDGKLTFPTPLTHDAVLVGEETWRRWLNAPETTAFRFQGEGTAFSARREFRRGHAYWYAYRRRGPRLDKVYLGRPDELDLDRLRTAAARLSGMASSSLAVRIRRAPPSSGGETSFMSRLPATATRLIGRERDIATVRERLLADGARLVTLTGAGGTGKTRLAVEAATRVADAFPDGVVFVDLAPLSRPGQVVLAIARALGLRDLGERPVRDSVYEWLRPRHALLLLDNFEHLLPAAADLADLLADCEQVRALVTSREALRLRWERLIFVPPLDLPARQGEDSLEQIARSPAVVLFVERARDRNPAFDLTAANASAVAEICARLDGLPLAIELAAARTRLLTPQELTQRLNRRLPLLDEGPRDAPGRQRTLGNAIGWSHDLLSIEEQVLFRRLAVFVGGFTVTAAETVAGRPGQPTAASARGLSSSDVPVLDLLQSLVDKSLLKPELDAAETRFRLLETVREYGIEQLEASGEADALQASHAAYCLALVRQINADPDEENRSDRLEREHDNVRAALRWAIEDGDLLTGLRLAAALRRFWWHRGYLSEGRRWLAELLGRAREDTVLRLTPEWATALGAAGYLAWTQADYGAALAHHSEALEHWLVLGNRRGEAASRAFLGTALCFQGDQRGARPLLEQALAGWRALGHTVGAANALLQLGSIALFEERYADADDLLRQALALHREATDVNDVAYDLIIIGYVAVHRGQLAEAREHLGAARELVAKLDHFWGVLYLLEASAALAVADGDAARALRLVGASSALRDRTGAHLPPAFRDCLDRWLLAARRLLSAAEAEAAMSSGRSLTPGQAISAEQLQALLADDPAPKARGQPTLLPLTSREQEITTCVARGWTNDQIAASLVVSRRTVESHVSHIMSKLNFATRSQLAVWATQHGLTEPQRPG